MVEGPSASSLLDAVHQWGSHGHGNISPASDDGSNASRIATIKSWMDLMEK